ncbi:ribulose-phosphate 3-epimerase [bacterium]|nr:ribulose-phosphate 3-epimerase [bacterium]NIN91823.1 ribulose-phosphate 3-epimerase [bacterium]NIO18109.1 ribulose-phosphate 3-epimerase [bacterium]NIO73074.1 ribulose-phosphate 3-epimerase [bacterium]
MREDIEIVPSLLSADFAILAEEIKKVEEAGCKRLHLDVMDGNFVPNITMGPVIIESIRRRTKLLLDAHLMVQEPERYLDDFKRAGVNSIIIHQEACCNFLKTVQQIKKLDTVAGIALRPGTPVKSIKDVIQEMELILIMTVEPGFGGQPYMAGIEKKIIEVRNLMKEKGLEIPIEVDGGINTETAPLVVKAGATRLVAGHAIFTGDVVENVEKLRHSVESI